MKRDNIACPPVTLDKLTCILLEHSFAKVLDFPLNIQINEQ